jgi:hypothetical protein
MPHTLRRARAAKPEQAFNGNRSGLAQLARTR